MIDNQTLGTAIKAKYDGTAGATLRGLLGTNKLAQDQAPQTTAFPYVVFQVISDVPNNTFNKELSSCRVQFSIWYKYGATNNLGTIARALYDLFHKTALTITGYTHTGTQMLSAGAIPSDDSMIGGYRIDFEIWAEKS